MSRTWHHGRKARERKFYIEHYRGGNPPKCPTPRKRRRTEQPYYWMNTPGWWNRVMNTRPWRARTRELLHRVMTMRDLEEWPPFPKGKRPHVYFW